MALHVRLKLFTAFSFRFKDGCGLLFLRMQARRWRVSEKHLCRRGVFVSLELCAGLDGECCRFTEFRIVVELD